MSRALPKPGPARWAIERKANHGRAYHLILIPVEGEPELTSYGTLEELARGLGRAAAGCGYRYAYAFQGVMLSAGVESCQQVRIAGQDHLVKTGAITATPALTEGDEQCRNEPATTDLPP